ncbi:unnamed protein product [Arctogadus glacialis]
MAAGLSGVIKCVIFAILIPIVSAGDNYCKSYYDSLHAYHPAETCSVFCCGSCIERYCCQSSFMRFTEDQQEDCIDHGSSNSSITIGSMVTGGVIGILIIIACCVCPCCCLYKICRKPRPVIATTTHTTVVTHTPQHYPQQPTASPGIQGPSYQGGQVPGYQSVPVQPGYGAQPMPQQYGAQPMPQAYSGQPMPQAYSGQPMPQAYGGQPMAPAPYPAYTPGPPPAYQEAMGPSYGPSPMAYSQAAFTPGQPSYPLQPPGQPHAQANVPTPPADQGQPAYNPAYAQPPPKTGY